MLGILTADETRTGSRGNYYRYDLAVPLQAAVDALDEELPLGGVIAGVRNRTPGVE